MYTEGTSFMKSADEKLLNFLSYFTILIQMKHLKPELQKKVFMYLKFHKNNNLYGMSLHLNGHLTLKLFTT